MTAVSERAGRDGAARCGKGDFERDVEHLFVRGAVPARQQRRAHRVVLAERRTRAVLVVVSAAPAQAMAGCAQVLREKAMAAAPRSAIGATKEERHHADALLADTFSSAI